MFTSIQQFKKDWNVETENTLKIFNVLTNESLSQKVYEDGRTIADIAWHIVLTLGEMSRSAGLTPIGPEENADNPNNVQTYIDTYKISAESVLNDVMNTWTDEKLNEMIDMYGENWERGYMLEVLIRHEIHHRAQLTVLMRQASLIVPGLYGPAKEEWSAYGMPAAK